MLNTLWSQTTLDHNVPSDQKLGTFWIFTQCMTPMCPVVKFWSYFEFSLLCHHNVPSDQKLGTFWMLIGKWSQWTQWSKVQRVSNEISPFDHTLPPIEHVNCMPMVLSKRRNSSGGRDHSGYWLENALEVPSYCDAGVVVVCRKISILWVETVKAKGWPSRWLTF